MAKSMVCMGSLRRWHQEALVLKSPREHRFGVRKKCGNGYKRQQEKMEVKVF